MPDRIANIVILAEDTEQQNLVFRFLERCNRRVTYRDCRFEKPAKRSGGSGEQFVRMQYSVEVKEHRRRVGKGTSALLVTMIDADMGTTQHRSKQLSDALRNSELEQRDTKEAISVLIPKRHVETWIRALRHLQVEEDADYKNPKPTAAEIREAAETLHQWTRLDAIPGNLCPQSLTDSLPEWQKSDQKLKP